MTTLDQIITHSRSMPEDAQQEILRFINLLELRRRVPPRRARSPTDTPITDSLVGILKNPDADKAAYHRYLEQKYR